MIDGVSVIFLVLLVVTAILYSSVGHGGASGYLALMALFSFSPDVMKPTALLLNIFVSLIAFIHYYRSVNISWNLFLPLAITSVPAAFIGGYITPDHLLYKQMLGTLLLIPAVRFAIPVEQKNIVTKNSNVYASLAIGAGIGFISGMIGIGGGILLSPLLLLLGWADIKQTAAISALFILVNSVSGMTGQFQHEQTFSAGLLVITIAALLGGTLGSYSGAFHFNPRVLKIILAAVLVIASIKLVMI